MHIVFVTTEYPNTDTVSGGLANYTRKTALSLVQRGHRVTVVMQSGHIKRWTDCGISVYEVDSPSLTFGLNSSSIIKQLIRVFNIVFSAYKIKKQLCRINEATPIDIIQASNYLSPGLFLTNNKLAPLVCRVSSYAPLLHAAYGQPRSFGDIIIDYLELYQLQMTNHKFSPSEFMIKIYLKYEGLGLDLIRTSLDAYGTTLRDMKLYSFIKKKIGSDQYLLYFGSMSKIKGVDLLASIIPGILNKYHDVAFVFIGHDYGLPNGQPIKDYVLSRCQESRKNKILFFPEQKKELLYPVIEMAIGTLSPSRIDNYPNACLESLSLGIPVIGTKDSSIEEIITDGKTGFLAHNGSAKDLSRKIDLLLSMSGDARTTMKDRIRRVINTIKDEDRVGMLISYYEKALSNHKKEVHLA